MANIMWYKYMYMYNVMYMIQVILCSLKLIEQQLLKRRGSFGHTPSGSHLPSEKLDTADDAASEYRQPRTVRLAV